MNSLDERCEQLRAKLVCGLLPLITCDYVLLDLPFYNNVGDVLIWEGTEQLLVETGHRCLYRASVETFQEEKVPDNCLILLQGGGNFGDYWVVHQQFRKKVVELFPNHRIIILPQTVAYKHYLYLKRDSTVFSKHKNLTICVRDWFSYLMLRLHGTCNDVRLLPDMAYGINRDMLKSLCFSVAEKPFLFVKRKDQELLSGFVYQQHLPKGEIEEDDWVDYDHGIEEWMHLRSMIHASSRDLGAICDYAYNSFRLAEVRFGCRFLSNYQKIYTTRMHAFILSTLLGKEVVLFDNSYGKNSGFFRSWFRNTNNAVIHMSRTTLMRQLLTFIKCAFKLTASRLGLLHYQ